MPHIILSIQTRERMKLKEHVCARRHLVQVHIGNQVPWGSSLYLQRDRKRNSHSATHLVTDLQLLGWTRVV